MYHDSISVVVLSGGETRAFERGGNDASLMAGVIAARMSERPSPATSNAYCPVLNDAGELLGYVYKDGNWYRVALVTVVDEGCAKF